VDEETPDLTPIPIDPRPLNAEEAKLIEFLLRDPFAATELRKQVEQVRVVSRCGCGCASVNLAVDAAVPAAEWDPADSPMGRSDWVPLIAHGTDAVGKDVEVTLHVTVGYLNELEIWTGGFGDFTLPVPETLRLEERLAAKTQYAVAHALAERLRRHIPAEIELTPTKLGSIDLRARGDEPTSAHGYGGLEATAQSLLDGVEWRLSESLDEDWLPCPAEDDNDECACSEAHAQMVGDALQLWYGDKDSPSLVLPPVTMEELTRLESLWRPQFPEASS
jgi:hypothetical protein